MLLIILKDAVMYMSSKITVDLLRSNLYIEHSKSTERAFFGGFLFSIQESQHLSFKTYKIETAALL